MKRYDTWTEARREQLLQKLTQIPLEASPKISIILPVYNPPLALLQKTIASVQAQVWTQWELCIADDGSTDSKIIEFLTALEKKESRVKLCLCHKQAGIAASTNTALAMASGDFVAFLDHDDLLPAHALAEVALAIHKTPEVSFLYSDEDKIDRRGNRCDPFFKPDWNPDLLTSLNYCSHLSVIRRSLVAKVGGIKESVEGAQDWDLLLRVTEQLHSDQIVHLPHVLYHWRISANSTAGSITAKPHVIAASRRALEEHLQRTHRAFTNIEQVHEGGHWCVNYALPEPAPSVSVIIPTRNRLDLLERCVNSIKSQTDYPHYEILIADNDSDDPKVLEFYRQQTAKKNIHVLKIPGPFNYSSINNRAAAEARGEVLVLLNNDIEVTHASWLRELVAHAIRPEVGAVGALLLYPNGKIQHAGVILGIGGVAGHVGKKFSQHREVGGNRTKVVQNFSAVTGACLAVRKKLYQEVGGLDETNLPVSFNDVDFCLKLQAAGYWNVWTPQALLIHHESASRGAENTPAKIKRFHGEIATMQQRWGDFLKHDPAYNPHLTLQHEDWSLNWNSII